MSIGDKTLTIQKLLNTDKQNHHRQQWQQAQGTVPDKCSVINRSSIEKFGKQVPTERHEKYDNGVPFI